MLARSIGPQLDLGHLNRKRGFGSYVPKTEFPLWRLCARLMRACRRAGWWPSKQELMTRFISLTGQMRKNLELMARLTRELVPQPSVVSTTNSFVLFEHPAYVQVIAALCMALRPFPEARQAVLSALQSFTAADERSVIDVQPSMPA